MMTPKEFEAKFLRAGELLNVFHQKATDAQRYRWVFWPVLVLVAIGAGAVIWWLV